MELWEQIAEVKRKIDSIEYQGIQPKLNPMCTHNFVPSSPPHKDKDGNWVKYPALCSRCGKWSKE